MYRLIRLIALSASVGLAVSAGAADSHGPSLGLSGRPLTLADLEQLALQGHPRLMAEAERVAAARGRQLQAGLYPNPIIAYDASSIGSDETAGQHGFFAEQRIVTGGKRRWNQATEGYETIKRQWQATAEHQRIVTGVRRYYYQILALQQQIEQGRVVVALSEELEQKAEELQDSDEANEADLLLARGASRRRRLDLQNRESGHRAAWQEMAAWIGLPQLPPARLQDSLDTPAPGYSSLGSDLEAIEKSPELAAARAEVSRARLAIGLAKAQATPDVTVRVGAYYDYADEQSNGSVRVSLPLPLYDRNQGNILTAEAELRRACADLEQTRRELQQRLAQILDRHRRSEATIKEYRDGVLPEARRAYELYLERFAEEKSSYSSASTALDNYVDRMGEYLEALRELREAEAELSGAMVVDRNG